MAACGRHFQRPPRLLLPLHIGKVGIRKDVRCQHGLMALQGGLAAVRGKMRADFEQAVGGIDAGIADERRLVRIRLRQDEGAWRTRRAALHGKGHGQGAADGPQLARERQFAREFVVM